MLAGLPEIISKVCLDEIPDLWVNFPGILGKRNVEIYV